MEENGTWAQNGNTVTITSQISEEVTTLTLQSDGTLLAMVDGVAMYFTQTAAAPQATNAPGGGLLPDGLLPSTGGTAPATGSFEGQWVLTKASANGQTIDPAAMGAQMTVTFNAGGNRHNLGRRGIARLHLGAERLHRHRDGAGWIHLDVCHAGGRHDQRRCRRHNAVYGASGRRGFALDREIPPLLRAGRP